VCAWTGVRRANRAAVRSGRPPTPAAPAGAIAVARGCVQAGVRSACGHESGGSRQRADGVRGACGNRTYSQFRAILSYIVVRLIAIEIVEVM
jgi:hypothetical protein